MAAVSRVLLLCAAALAVVSLMRDPWQFWLDEYRGRAAAAAPAPDGRLSAGAPIGDAFPAARLRTVAEPDTARKVRDVVRSLAEAQDVYPHTFADDHRGRRIAFSGMVHFTDHQRTIVISSEWFGSRRVSCRFPRLQQEGLAVGQRVTAQGTFGELTRRGAGWTLALEDCRLLPELR